MRKLTRSMTAIAAGVTLSAAVVPVAYGASNNGQCEYKEVCVFKHTGYSGPIGDIAGDDPAWGNNPWSNGVGDVGNDASSGGSVGKAFSYYVDQNYQGASFLLGIDQYDNNWADGNVNGYIGSWNDSISSSLMWG